MVASRDQFLYFRLVLLDFVGGQLDSAKPRVVPVIPCGFHLNVISL